MRELGPAGPDQARQAEHLAGADLQRNAAHAGRGAADPGQREHRGAGVGGSRRINLRDLAADHQLDQAGLVDCVGRAGADAFAVAEDRHAVGEAEDLIEPVGNVDDADAVRAQLGDYLEEQFLLALGEGGGGFVHDHEPRAGAEGAGDLDELLLGHRQRAHGGIGRDWRADAGEQPGGGGPARLPIDATKS